MSTELLKQAVDYFGNQKKAADALGITQPTLNHSLSTGVVSAEVALRIQKATGGKFKAVDLRPSLKARLCFYQCRISTESNVINQDSKPTNEKGSTAVTVKPLCSNMEKPNMNMPILHSSEILNKKTMSTRVNC